MKDGVKRKLLVRIIIALGIFLIAGVDEGGVVQAKKYETYEETIQEVKWKINVYPSGEGVIYPASSKQIAGKITVPDTVAGQKVTAIKEYAFEECGKLEKLEFSQCTSLKKIGDSACIKCSALKEVEVSGCINLTTIEDGAFAYCSSLESMDLSSCTKLDVIGDYTFYSCDKIETIDLSGCSSLSKLGKEAMACCGSLMDILISPENGNYLSADGGVYTKAGNKLITFSGGRQEGKGIDSVKEIGEYALEGAKIERLDLSECRKLTVIGYYAFTSCQYLKDICLPDSLETVKYEAFSETVVQNIYYCGTYEKFKRISIDTGSGMFKGSPNIIYMEISVITQPENQVWEYPQDIIPLEVETTYGIGKDGNQTGTLSYQWYQNTTNSNTGGIQIQGATDRRYKPDIEKEITYCYCEITSQCDNFTYTTVSDVAVVEVTCGTEFLENFVELKKTICDAMIKIESGIYVENVKFKTYKVYVMICKNKLEENEIHSKEELHSAKQKIQHTEEKLTLR